MRRKYVISVFVALCIAMSGCGGKANDVKNENTDISDESVEASEAKLPESEAGVTEDENSVTKGTSFDGDINDQGEYEIVRIDTDEEEVVVPDAIDGAPVVKIGSYACSAEESVKRIVLPNSVTKIESYAFLDCTSLESIELGTGIKSIGALAFANCKKLQKLTIPDGATWLTKIVSLCPELKEIYIPASVTEIEGIVVDETCPNAVIVTPSGSFAEAHAIENGLNYRNE